MIRDPHIEAARRARAERDAMQTELLVARAELERLRQAAPSRELSGFSTDQLLAEIVRRRRTETATTQPEQFCETCINFVAKENATEKYNPCRKGHTMDFWMEPDPIGPEPLCGFHRAVCEDRA